VTLGIGSQAFYMTSLILIVVIFNCGVLLVFLYYVFLLE